MGDYGIQIAIMLGIFLSILGFTYFLKSRSANVAQVNTKEQQKNAVPQTSKRSYGTWLKETLGTKEGATEAEKTFKKRALLMVLFIFTVTLGYVLDDGPSKLINLGLIVIGVFHVYVLWVAFVERNISDAAMTWAAGWFIILVVGWALPGPMWQTWDDTKKLWRENKDDPDLFKKALGALGSSSPAASTSTAPQAKTFWLPNVKIDNYGFTEVQIPRGAEVTFYCVNGGSQVSYWEGGPEEGVLQTCGEDLPMRARKKYGLRMEFSAATVEEVTNWQNNPEMSPPPLRESNVMIKVEA